MITIKKKIISHHQITFKQSKFYYWILIGGDCFWGKHGCGADFPTFTGLLLNYHYSLWLKRLSNVFKHSYGECRKHTTCAGCVEIFSVSHLSTICSLHLIKCTSIMHSSHYTSSITSFLVRFPSNTNFATPLLLLSPP